MRCTNSDCYAPMTAALLLQQYSCDHAEALIPVWRCTVCSLTKQPAHAIEIDDWAKQWLRQQGEIE